MRTAPRARVGWMRKVLLSVALLGLAGLGTAYLARHRIKELGKEVLGRIALRDRVKLRSGEPPFSRLAASQLGYGPAMRKEFTSPRPFTSFRVLREDGSVALEGGGSSRSIETRLLGPIDRVWIGDFTALSAPGRYRVVTDAGLESFPFDVSADVFDRALRAVQRAFYYQRAFTAIEAPYAEGPWVHASDAHLAPPGEEKGWHDAGDFSLYNASATTALFYLLEAYLDFAPASDDTNIPESGNGVPDLLDEARWELAWMLSVQDPSGGFRNTTCQEGYGRYGDNLPERMGPYRSGEVGTVATGRATGTLARAAHVFRRVDPAFADRCLQAALRGHAYLKAHPGESSDGPTCPAMRQDGNEVTGREVRMYAAAGLLLATGDPRYERDFAESFVDVENDPGYQRSNVFAALTYLRAPGGDPARKEAIRARLRQAADRVLADGEAHPFRWAKQSFWGSIAAGFHRSLFAATQCLKDPLLARADCEQVVANLHHAFGRNYQLMSYVSGIPGVTRGRQNGFHHWLATLRATPYLFPGLVAGGPMDAPPGDDRSFPHGRPVPAWGYWGDPAFPRDGDTPLEGRYTDNDSWSTNELDVDWQGAALYSLHLARWYARGAPQIGDPVTDPR